MSRVKDKAAYERGYDAGVKIACALNGTTPGDVIRRSAFVDAALASVEMQTALCKVASHIFEEAGMAGSMEHVLYSRLAHNNHALSPYSVERFIAPVADAIAKEAKVSHEEIMEKIAAPVLVPGAISRVLGRIMGSTPEIARLASILGVGAGAATGALTWALTRDSTQEDVDTEAKLQQAEHYRRVAKDLQKRLKIEEEEHKATQAIKETVADAGEGAYVI